MSARHGAELFENADRQTWQAALDSYPSVIAAQGVADLLELDTWYREALPGLIQGQDNPHLTIDELCQLVRWKMRRGEWRARNLALVRANAPDEVQRCTEQGFAPDIAPRKALAAICELGGVGPATASAALAAVKPETFPFLDDLVGAAIPSIGKPAFTVGYYFKYAEALRSKAQALGSPWTAQSVGLALWAAIGGKAAACATNT